jgi:hypothetical protein
LLTPYKIVVPTIDSGSTFYFTTDSGLKYEVKFGRKSTNIFNVSIVFGVLNDEFDGEEYSLTNRGEVYTVMATLVEVVRYYKEKHPKITEFEFSGEPTNENDDKEGAKRLKLYSRYLTHIFDTTEWKQDDSESKIRMIRL